MKLMIKAAAIGLAVVALGACSKKTDVNENVVANTSDNTAMDMNATTANVTTTNVTTTNATTTNAADMNAAGPAAGNAAGNAQ